MSIFSELKSSGALLAAYVRAARRANCRLRPVCASTMLSAALLLVLAAQPPHDPEVYCTACIRLVANLQDGQGVVPMLRAAVTLAKTHRPELGALDALAEEYVIERGCKWYATWNNLTIRKACLHITEEHGESLVEKITRWATKGRPDLC